MTTRIVYPQPVVVGVLGFQRTIVNAQTGVCTVGQRMRREASPSEVT